MPITPKTGSLFHAETHAMLYRADAPFNKLATPVYTSPDDRAHKVEVLCRGQQVVVHGMHPTTLEPYTWHCGKPGPELKRDALPLLTEDKAKEFIAAAEQCMSARGWTAKKQPNGNGHAADTNGFLNTTKPTTERERLYARAALESCADELAAAPKGSRNDVLNRKSFRLGTMAARGWIARTEVIDTLFRAAEACGLNADDGDEATRKTLESGLNNGEKHPHPDLDTGQQEGFTEPTARRTPWRYHTGVAPAPMRWLIKGILAETGAALEAGQWGTFKTTVALDMSVCVMAGLPFAGRYRVKRRGAVLYFALEGEGMLSARLSAIAAHHQVTGPLPFAWRGDCPALTDKNAADVLCNIVNEASAELEREFGLPVVLIWIDTLITAAGYAEGGDNDTAASQRVMNTMRSVSQRTGALVVGIDHFGKVVETGTRGSSAKEGAADAVIALLADRELGGGVKNTRLAVRKQRDGISGFEIPFTARMIETGTDEDGDSIAAPVIDWQAAQQVPQAGARWTPSMQVLRRILMNTLGDCGQDVRPFPDGPVVRACDVEAVRSEFYKQYPADGTEKQKADARRKAFGRSINDSQARGLVASREVEGVQLIWLATTEPTGV
jgi:hypothetical protein